MACYKPVTLGKKILIPYVATHWAVKVDDTWYEVPGTSKKDSSSSNQIERSYGTVARSGAVPLGGGLVGTTMKSQSQIDEFIRDWLCQNPVYNFTTTNCQKFAKDFVDFLCDGCAKLPMMEAGVRGCGHGPSAWTASSDGAAIAAATTGRSEIQHGVARAAAEGPSAGAKAVCGNQGFGAFAAASAGRAEAAVGGVGVHLDLNINTGIGFHNGNGEASLIGFGIKIGHDGLELNTPIAGTKCSIM